MTRLGKFVLSGASKTLIVVPAMVFVFALSVGACALGPAPEESFSDSEILDAIQEGPETIEQLKTELSRGIDPSLISIDRLVGVVAEGPEEVVRWFEIMNKPRQSAGPNPGEPSEPVQNFIVWREGKRSLNDIARVHSLRAPETGLKAARSSGNTYRIFEGKHGEFLGWLPPPSMRGQ